MNVCGYARALISISYRRTSFYSRHISSSFQLRFTKNTARSCQNGADRTKISNSTEPIPTEGKPELDVATIDYWTDRWTQGTAHWHKPDVHVFLDKHQDKLFLGRTGLKILVPLCGKTVDMKWLAEKGHTVVGIEGVVQPILDFFTENNMKYTREALTDISGYVYKSANDRISIYECDLFDFKTSLCGTFDCIWDRCSLVALVKEDRERYVKIIKDVASPSCLILIATVDYDGSLHPGPPHLVSKTELEHLFGEEYEVEIIDKIGALQPRWTEKGMTYFDEILQHVKPT